MPKHQKRVIQMISDEHISILKNILRQKEYRIPFPDPLESQLRYLETLGYVSLICSYTEHGDPCDSRHIITEKGKAFLCERKRQSKDKWIPYIITTLISVLALMKSYGFGIDDAVIWCMRQLGLI